MEPSLSRTTTSTSRRLRHSSPPEPAPQQEEAGHGYDDAGDAGRPSACRSQGDNAAGAITTRRRVGCCVGSLAVQLARRVIGEGAIEVGRVHRQPFVVETTRWPIGLDNQRAVAGTARVLVGAAPDLNAAVVRAVRILPG